MRERLKQLQSLSLTSSELRRALRSNAGLRNEIEALSAHFLGGRPRGCSNCYFDYFFRLRGIKEKEKKVFELKVGALLYDPANPDAGKAITRHTCTDEQALYYLFHYPECRRLFSTLPENVDELIADYEKSLPDARKDPQPRP